MTPCGPHFLICCWIFVLALILINLSLEIYLNPKSEDHLPFDILQAVVGTRIPVYSLPAIGSVMTDPKLHSLVSFLSISCPKKVIRPILAEPSGYKKCL